MEVFDLVILGVVALISLLLVLREFTCWYFKINERLKIQHQQAAHQTLIIDLLAINNELLQEEKEARNYKY